MDFYNFDENFDQELEQCIQRNDNFKKTLLSELDLLKKEFVHLSKGLDLMKDLIKYQIFELSCKEEFINSLDQEDPRFPFILQDILNDIIDPLNLEIEKLRINCLKKEQEINNINQEIIKKENLLIKQTRLNSTNYLSIN